MEVLDDDNFLEYAAHVYDNPQCSGTEEFLEDMNRIKYIKKLLTRYTESGELKDHLILNHLVVLGNVFGPIHLPRILYFKMEKQFSMIKPFLVLIGMMPEYIVNIRKRGNVETDMIQMDPVIVDRLRKI